MLPKLNPKENSKSCLKIFGGLDRRHVISDSSLADMRNMSCEDFPTLSPCRENKTVTGVSSPSAIFSPEYNDCELTSFTGISNGKFIYNGKEISGELSAGEKSIADFNGKICIFPDKVYYDYIPDPGSGEVSTSLTPMEKGLSVKKARFYSSSDKITGEYTSYISVSDAEFESCFSIGDSIVISGCTVEENNVILTQSRKQAVSADSIVSAVITKLTDTKLYLSLYKKSGERTGFENCTEEGEISIRLAIPDMDHICVHNNRLWGTASSGEYIYASKLGDPSSFNSFQGLSDDSWYSYVATGGRFTGICSYRTAVVAFKENCIHHIYGDSPRNFSIPKHTAGGCRDGKSICEISGILYYLSPKGFSAYNGGEPYTIASPLNRDYSFCTGATDGRHYFVSAKAPDGLWDYMVYTPEMNLWTYRDRTAFVGMCQYNGRVYGITENKMIMLDSGEKASHWSATTKDFSYDHFESKAVNELFIRAEINPSACIRVYISYDDGAFTECGLISGKTGLSAYRIPVRFRKCDSFKLKLEGEGEAYIHTIEITNYKGGKNCG